jgi:hypothetical protein
MPMPIRPNSSEKNSSNYFPIDLNFDSLLNPAPMKKQALASDGEASLLFDIWNNSVVVNNSSCIENRVYKIKGDANNSDIMRLKISGLISGDANGIKFTNKGASIIKTIVLGEQNSFSKKSVKKPYSIILAEQQKPKRKSTLALANEMKKDKCSELLEKLKNVMKN